MADAHLNKALALLKALRDNLPEGDIEEKYVNLYHATLVDVQNEIRHDLNYFSIPATELKRHVTSYSLNPIVRRRYVGREAETTYSDERYCDREMFLIKINGAINFINSLMPEQK